MMRVAIAMMLVPLVGCPPRDDKAAKRNDEEVNACVQRGIAYYKDIGSWPTLSNGEDALEKVTTRCGRSIQAF